MFGLWINPTPAPPHWCYSLPLPPHSYSPSCCSPPISLPNSPNPQGSRVFGHEGGLAAVVNKMEGKVAGWGRWGWGCVTWEQVVGWKAGWQWLHYPVLAARWCWQLRFSCQSHLLFHKSTWVWVWEQQSHSHLMLFINQYNTGGSTYLCVCVCVHIQWAWNLLRQFGNQDYETCSNYLIWMWLSSSLPQKAA